MARPKLIALRSPTGLSRTTYERRPAMIYVCRYARDDSHREEWSRVGVENMVKGKANAEIVKLEAAGWVRE